MTADTLAALFNQYGTDKARNGYHNVYAEVFESQRDSVQRLLEVGIGTMVPDAHSSMTNYAGSGYTPGGSLRAWRDYFPKAVVWGLDTQPDTQFQEDGIVTVLGDSTNTQRVGQLFGGTKFDLIIDDGDHVGGSQVSTLCNLWRYVRPGGFYAIEDISDGDVIEIAWKYAQRPTSWLSTEQTLLVMQRA